ncbi:MAG: M6 family metalloprotease domain-containing protein, partial [Candidatus Cloacimonetes bacterium]|nr:M6 family metalloprotease domain-containing protein [Candidatus Cloacimonadota bacterium]
GEPVASKWRVNSINPEAMGLTPHLTISPQTRDRNIAAMNSYPKRNLRGPNTGTVNNLNVFIRFSDQTEFTLSREMYDARFNAIGDSDISLRNYFQKVSYNQLTYVTHHYPESLPQTNLSYQDSHPRSYYMPYNTITNPDGYNDSDERTFREHTLLANAINSIANQVPSNLVIDADNDGSVDNVCFIIRGPHTAWAELLWAHRWALYTSEAYINGKQVWDFTFQPEDQNSVRTLCHEMFHSVGAPDLYHYTYNGITPAGCWDIMESGNGHMGMYMKYKYGGWLESLPSITTNGTYTLNPVSSATNNVYKMSIAGNNSQFLVFEYRKRGSDIYEAELPGSGLLIYRINQNYSGNADGPPDEVYIFRPNGNNNVNGLIAEAAFCAEEGRTDFNAYTNPAAFLSNGNLIQVNINNITTAGETISFQVSSSTANLAPVIHSISPVSGSILANTPFTLTAEVSAPNSSVNYVEFLVNGLLSTTDTESPYTAIINGTDLGLGWHQITVIAHSINGMQTSRNSTVEIINPAQENWFTWVTDSPLWSDFGRGAVPIKVAVDFDLGTQEYYVKGLKFRFNPDPWGTPDIPGLVTAQINRFASGAITEQPLMLLGTIINQDYDPNFVFVIADSTRISGQIAVILDLYEYQNITFDANAPSGHTWLTEPNRTWTDALARGMQGAASIQLLLQSPVVGSEDVVIPVNQLQLANYPNPFVNSTTISYGTKAASYTTLCVYNLKGQKVKTLHNGDISAGSHTISWDGRDENNSKVANGVYYYRLNSDGVIKTAKMLLVQ